MGGVLGGLAAAGTATVVGQRSNSDPRADDAIDGDGGGAGCCTDDTVAAPFMTATVSFSATNPSSTVTEEVCVHMCVFSSLNPSSSSG